MDKLVYVKFEVLMAEILSKIYPKIYEKYVVIEHRQIILYETLAHPLYGNLQASILSWRKLAGILVHNR